VHDLQRLRWACVPIGLLLLLTPAVIEAQTSTATLFIEARDESGALLPGVVISLTNQENGIGRAGVTTPDGTLVVPLLPAAAYTLTAALDGFKTEIIRDIRVQAATKGTLNLVLQPGPLTEQVIVTADEQTLRIGNSTVGEVFEDRTLMTLPVTERDALQFTYQAPGVAPPAPGSRLSTQGNIGVNSSGAREAANNFLLDGADNNDLFLNRLVVNPSLDAIEEMALLQNTYDAEYGRSAGAQVNMVLKSGTRDLRGSAYEFFRNSALDARHFFEPSDEPKAELRKHQFGGTLGGPIGGLPSFFFVNAEAVRAREAETRLAHVPTAAERAGDFRGSGVTIVDPFTGRPFAGNQIPSSRMSPAGLATAALYPVPNRNDPEANLVSSPAGERNAVQATIKTDHHRWRENPFFIRYSFSRDDRKLPFPAHGRNLPGFGVSVLDQGHNLAAGVSQALSPRLFNDVRIGLNALRRENLPQALGFDAYDALGITGPVLDDTDIAYPTFVLPGYETLGDDPNLPVVRRTKTLHVSDSLSIDLARHHLKMGGEFRHYQSNGYNHLFSRGEASFFGVYTGHPVADLLLGLPTFSLLAVNDNRQALRTHAVNLFAQDDWRVTPRITVNAGVRYEYNAPPIDADDRMRIFDLDAQELVEVGTNGVSRSGLETDLNNVAPRVGVSWDLTGRGTWLLRGGYGLFYDSGTLIENSALYFNPPYFTLQLFFPTASAPIFLDDPFPTDSGLTPSPAVNSLDPHFRTAYSHHATLGLERAFSATTLAARYVSTHGRNMVRKRNINQPPPGPGDIDPRRPIQGFGDILLVESQAWSSYHALQLSAVRRYSRHLAFRASYTWSKSLDDASAFLATDGDDNTPQDSRNVAAEWGPSDFDVRHRLVLTATYDLPAVGDSPFLRDWQVSAVFSAQAGRPFTPRVSFDNSNTGNIGGGTFAYDRPNVVEGAVPPGATPVSYDGRTFVVAPPFTFGNAGRNSLTGPSYAALDAAIARRVTFGAARWLELRLEVFNALNRQNLQLPDSFVDRATFGESLSAFPPRQLQLAARLTF
jgi:Carboxypeptidase regulatory-like domain/TonB dependent receptor-like, beta-barrel